MDTLTKQDISDIVTQILWGKSFVDASDRAGDEHTFILRSLSIRENNYLNHIHKKEYETARSLGILTEDELKSLFYEVGLWGDEQEQLEESLTKELKKLSGQLRDSEFHTVRKKILKKQIAEKEKQLKDLQSTKQTIFTMSAENRAEEYKRRLMIWMCTETIDEEPYWPQKEVFMKSTDDVLMFNLVVAYFKNNLYDEKTLRAVARSPEWRFRWQAAKHGEQLFGRPIADWSEMQNMLVYWSEYYDGVYESLDRPPNHIIEDDKACDAWVQEQNKKVSRGTGKSESKNIYGRRRATQKLDHQEQFVAVPRGDAEAVKKVQEMNSEGARKKLRQEFEQLKKAGGKHIKEWELGNRSQETPTKVVRKGR